MRDFYLAALVGFSVGFLILLPLVNIGFELTPLSVTAIIASFFGFSLLAFGIFRWLGIFWPIFSQLGKFAAIGALNSFLDLAIVNFFILLTGVTAGWSFSFFKAAGFLLAATNSYFWNKFWTFQSRSPVNWREYRLFGIFTVIGALINVATASLIVNFIGTPAGVSSELWANIGALAATAISLVFNFVLYKRVVFRGK